MNLKITPKEDAPEWVELTDLEMGTTLGEYKRAWIEFRNLEKKLAQDGYTGWIAWSAIDNFRMLRFLNKIGATSYYCDGEDIFFFKTLKHLENKDGTQKTRQKLNITYSTAGGFTPTAVIN